MATRKIVKIDEELCDGCGECVPSCAEGAIKIIDGKARLVSDNLCDGLGACLGDCPQDAISIEEREADEFDEAAVEAHLAGQRPATTAPQPGAPQPLRPMPPAGGCPGSRPMSFDPAPGAAATSAPGAGPASELRQWPVQLHLVPPQAPYFQGADVLLASDCSAFAAGDFHGRFLRGKALAVACPKLDHGQDIYLQKLVALIDRARIDTLTVLMMEVPCCGGLMSLAKQAVAQAERKVPIKKIVMGLQGQVLEETWD